MDHELEPPTEVYTVPVPVAPLDGDRGKEIEVAEDAGGAGGAGDGGERGRRGEHFSLFRFIESNALLEAAGIEHADFFIIIYVCSFGSAGLATDEPGWRVS